MNKTLVYSIFGLVAILIIGIGYHFSIANQIKTKPFSQSVTIQQNAGTLTSTSTLTTTKTIKKATPTPSLIELVGFLTGTETINGLKITKVTTIPSANKILSGTVLVDLNTAKSKMSVPITTGVPYIISVYASSTNGVYKATEINFWDAGFPF